MIMMMAEVAKCGSLIVIISCCNYCYHYCCYCYYHIIIIITITEVAKCGPLIVSPISEDCPSLDSKCIYAPLEC